MPVAVRDRVWRVAELAPPEFLAAHLDMPPVVVQLLWNRGLRERAEMDQFLNPDWTRDLHDPFLFRHMERAVSRVRDAIARREKIVVHGDYDADGVCGATLLWTTLTALGAVVDVFLPHREHDGYGVHEKTVRELAAKDVKVIITCDCGISCVPEVALAQSLGVDVIITDHHTLPPTLPPAYAILHPSAPGETYPWKGLSGGGVAFKFAQALLSERSGENGQVSGVRPEVGFEKWLLDLVSISSVADMVPLKGETRALVYYGLKVLERARRPGLRALMRAAGVLDEFGRPRRAIDATTIGFQIAPRINAAGRMEHASAAFRLLTAKDEQSADELALVLNGHNTARQQAVEKLMDEAHSLTSGAEDTFSPLVISGTDWPLGLLGLIASKLAEEQYRPTFVFSDRGGILTGSGRSIPGVDIMAALRMMPSAMTKFGGHAQACGVTLPRGQLLTFESELTGLLRDSFGTRPPTPAITVDTELDLDHLTNETADAITRFAPFGMDNPEPTLLTRGVRVVDVRTVGAEGKHLSLMGSQRGTTRKFIAFRLGPRAPSIPPGTLVDILYTVRPSEWNGRKELELSIRDFKQCHNS